MTESTQSRVSVVIPVFNSRKILPKTLAAVFATLRSGDELVIVDDDSQDHTAEWLIEHYHLSLSRHYQWAKIYEGTEKLTSRGEVQVILARNERNLRFGAAVNTGVVVAHHPFIFLLNSDVRPEKDCLSQLMSHAQDEQIFAVGCLEREAKGVVGGKNKLWFERGLFLHSRADDFSAGETAWVSGGSGLFSREKWLKLEGFSPEYYPAYWEDIDLSARAREHGWRIWFEPKAVVHHLHETTNAQVFGTKAIAQMSWEHLRLFAWRHANLWQKIAFLLWAPYWWWVQLKSDKA